MPREVEEAAHESAHEVSDGAVLLVGLVRPERHAVHRPLVRREPAQQRIGDRAAGGAHGREDDLAEAQEPELRVLGEHPEKMRRARAGVSHHEQWAGGHDVLAQRAARGRSLGEAGRRERHRDRQHRARLGPVVDRGAVAPEQAGEVRRAAPDEERRDVARDGVGQLHAKKLSAADHPPTTPTRGQPWARVVAVSTTAAPALRPVAHAGARVRLLLLAPGEGHAAGVDLDNGGLVWATWDPEASNIVPIRLKPLDVITARTHVNPPLPDPARPEAVTLDGPPVAVGRLRGRRAERLLRPLHHPERDQLLGFAGPAVPYWTLAGDRPSMAVVAPRGPVVLTPTPDGLAVRFTWRSVVHELPCTDAAAAAAVTANGGAVRAPRRLLVTLSEPYLGHCYKLVPTLLPA